MTTHRGWCLQELLRVDNRGCNVTHPCLLGEGDCDHDDQCDMDLMCGLNNCIDFHPSVGHHNTNLISSFLLRIKYERWMDCCTLPEYKYTRDVRSKWLYIKAWVMSHPI